MVVPSQAAGVNIGASMQTKPRLSKKSRIDLMMRARTRSVAACLLLRSHR